MTCGHNYRSSNPYPRKGDTVFCVKCDGYGIVNSSSIGVSGYNYYCADCKLKVVYKVTNEKEALGRCYAHLRNPVNQAHTMVVQFDNEDRLKVTTADIPQSLYRGQRHWFAEESKAKQREWKSGKFSSNAR